MSAKDSLILKEPTTRENRVWVRITAACNEKCLFCLDADAQNGELVPVETIRENIGDGFILGTYNRIILSGGEASINPRFGEYISYAREIGYDRIQTVTNGNMFARPDFTEKVIAAGLQEITFSMHGHRSSLHDYLTATPGSFDKAIRAIVYIKKYHPEIIINIDIVVNKVNITFLPDIVRFFLKMGIYEFDILQIIPFGRGFEKYKDTLFYKIEEHIGSLHDTWKLSRLPGVNIWTNRFPTEAFEGYEDLIQDPRKIASEVLYETYDQFSEFIKSDAKKKPDCFGDRCDVCFLHQYCHDFIRSRSQHKMDKDKSPPLSLTQVIGGSTIPEGRAIALRGDCFVTEIYEKFGSSGEGFIQSIQNISLSQQSQFLNTPRCIRADNNTGEYESYKDLQKENTVEEYTDFYISNGYRRKSSHCSSCKYNDTCQGIHVNYIRAYGFDILKPIL